MHIYIYIYNLYIYEFLSTTAFHKYHLANTVDLHKNLNENILSIIQTDVNFFSYIRISYTYVACHTTDVPPTTGLAGSCTANFVAVDGPAGPSMAAMDGLARLSTVP